MLRFGLEDGRFRTLEEVGREFGITRERIRQIEAKALRKLRHPSYSRKLRGISNRRDLQLIGKTAERMSRGHHSVPVVRDYDRRKINDDIVAAESHRVAEDVARSPLAGPRFGM